MQAPQLPSVSISFTLYPQSFSQLLAQVADAGPSCRPSAAKQLDFSFKLQPLSPLLLRSRHLAPMTPGPVQWVRRPARPAGQGPGSKSTLAII